MVNVPAKPTNVIKIDAAAAKARQDEITHAIRRELNSVVDATDDESLAKEGLDAARKTTGSARETVMGTLAGVASANQWTANEIDAAGAFGLVEAAGNRKLPRSVATYLSELKRAMHPNVAPFFPAFVTLRDEVWAAEVAALKIDKDAPAPLKAAFGRSYHALNAILSVAKDAEYCEDAADVVALAHARTAAQNADVERATGKLAAALALLAEVQAHHKSGELAAGIDMVAKAMEKLAPTVAAKAVAPVVKPAPVVKLAPVIAVTADDEIYSGVVDVHAAMDAIMDVRMGTTLNTRVAA